MDVLKNLEKLFTGDLQYEGFGAGLKVVSVTRDPVTRKYICEVISADGMLILIEVTSEINEDQI